MNMDVGTINKAERKYLLSRALFSKISFFILLALILGLLFIDYHNLTTNVYLKIVEKLIPFGCIAVNTYYQYKTERGNLEHERRQLERKRLEAERKNKIQALKHKQQQ